MVAHHPYPICGDVPACRICGTKSSALINIEPIREDFKAGSGIVL
jgi:hypothetical protein